MKRRDLVQSHSNRILFIAQWFGCLETCPTDHRVKLYECHPLGNNLCLSLRQKKKKRKTKSLAYYCYVIAWE